jgi:energy-converting hydrogenase A subunit M
MKLGFLSLLGAAVASFANLNDFMIKHVSFELTMTGELKSMIGTATLILERKTNSMELKLDSLVDVMSVVDKDEIPLLFKNNGASLDIKLKELKDSKLIPSLETVK